jgi:hypothetical protein
MKSSPWKVLILSTGREESFKPSQKAAPNSQMLVSPEGANISLALARVAGS